MSEFPLHQFPFREGCYMIGRRHRSSMLQCNTYLRSFAGPAGETVHWCIDPGPRLDYPFVSRHLLEHVGELTAVKFFSLSHPDPDVAGNLVYLAKESPNLTGLVTEDTWRLVQQFGLHVQQLRFVNQAADELLELPGGHLVQVVPAAFCHFRCAVAFYDLESRVLFSGDLFSGLNEPGQVQLYAGEADWPGIAQFHQVYMPSGSAVAQAIHRIHALDPPVEVIAPQHGFLLTGELMHAVLDWLEALPMGLDLVPQADQEAADAIQTCREASRVQPGTRALSLAVDDLIHGQFTGLRETLRAQVYPPSAEHQSLPPKWSERVERLGVSTWFG